MKNTAVHVFRSALLTIVIGVCPAAELPSRPQITAADTKTTEGIAALRAKANTLRIQRSAELRTQLLKMAHTAPTAEREFFNKLKQTLEAANAPAQFTSEQQGYHALFKSGNLGKHCQLQLRFMELVLAGREGETAATLLPRWVAWCRDFAKEPTTPEEAVAILGKPLSQSPFAVVLHLDEVLTGPEFGMSALDLDKIFEIHVLPQCQGEQRATAYRLMLEVCDSVAKNTFRGLMAGDYARYKRPRLEWAALSGIFKNKDSIGKTERENMMAFIKAHLDHPDVSQWLDWLEAHSAS